MQEGTPIRLVAPGNIRHRSGGNVYNARLADHLVALGAAVTVQVLDGGWPASSAEDRRRLAAVLDAAGTDVVILDGLVARGAPDEMEAAAQAGRRILVLAHAAAGGHDAPERRALAAAEGIICTGYAAAADIRRRYGLHANVVFPGTDPAPEQPRPPSQSMGDPHLVMVAALLPNKDQALLVEALAKIKELPWAATLVGSTEAAPAYAARVRQAIAEHGLEDRVRVTGELSGDALEEQWTAADLSLLISRSESFGMVVNEALARGIPVVVRAGTGAAETLGQYGAGVAVDLSGGPGPLADILRNWLLNPELRTQWRNAALAALPRLPRWEDAAAKVLQLVTANSGSNVDRGSKRSSPRDRRGHGAE